MKMNTILITGAAGLMGSRLAERLLTTEKNSSNKIVLLYHYEKPQFGEQENLVYVQGDVNDYTFLTKIISSFEVNVIYHFASNSIVRKCANDPYNAYMTNVMGMASLLEAVRNVGMNSVKKIIISTSDKVFGHAEPPYNEDTPFKPKFTYEATKACQDIVAQNYFYNYGLPINILRCSNIYGPHDPNITRLIPNAIKSINRKEKPIIFSGVKDYVREFVYVDDALDAFLLVAEKALPGEHYCVGGTESISIEGLVGKICSLMNFNEGVSIVEKPSNFQEIQFQSINATKLKTLGWNPKFTLEEGLKKCITSEYYK